MTRKGPIFHLLNQFSSSPNERLNGRLSFTLWEENTEKLLRDSLTRLGLTSHQWDHTDVPASWCNALERGSHPHLFCVLAVSHERISWPPQLKGVLWSNRPGPSKVSCYERQVLAVAVLDDRKQKSIPAKHNVWCLTESWPSKNQIWAKATTGTH